MRSSRAVARVVQSDSIVPRSHSRAMTMLPMKLQVSVMTTMVSPGTRYQTDLLASLNHARERSEMFPAEAEDEDD